MANETRQSLIRLAKRDQMETKYIWGIRIGSVLFALLLGCIPMMITGNNPFAAFATIANGSLSRPIYFKQTVKIAVPLLGCALAIAPCFKMRFWNIGAEGQITIGAIAASFFALKIAPEGSSPHWGLILLMMMAAAIAGGIWALIPAYFKAKYNTNETLFTLMMNYIAIGIVAYLQGGPWEGRKGSQIIPMFKTSARLPDVLGVHAGWIIVLILVVIMHIYMKYTKQGYEIAVIGDSENTARYAGMNVGWIIMRTMFISGAICGVVGFMVASGANHTLYKGVANGVGFTSITVAWLSQLNAFVMIAISFVLAVLSKGSQTLQTRLSVPASVSEIVTGILLFCMLGCEFFINYKVIIRENPVTDFCKETANQIKSVCRKIIPTGKSNAKEA
ncbi:MAG TPA: ABC transporter permease [Spirochaetaceae bacterium]|nr:ABC transporter permease [Spirochaetaceae bacterium]